MQRIVIVTDTWHPQVNGVVTSLQKTITLLENKNMKVTVIHPGLFWAIPLFFYPEIKLPPAPHRTMKALLKKERPNFIHIATEGPLGFAARAICLRNNLCFTTSYHTNFAQYAKARTGALSETVYSYLRWFHNAGSATMVSTESVQKELEAQGFKKLVLWPLGVDTDLFQRSTSPDNPHEKIPNFKKPIFAYLGRIAIEKNVEEYLELPLPGTKLVIGDGPLHKKLEREYGDRAVFTGYKTGQALIDWLSLCDVMVFPSRTETFGLVVLEALAMGIPVAAHHETGPKDIITHGVDGYLGEDLREAALACLTLPREKCREKALLFSWNNSVESFIRNLVPCEYQNPEDKERIL